MRATAFSAAELRQEDPISSKSASIGEEISSADVVRARWTPTGIAKHGRCALLVLTQNLLLSLWSPEKQPRHHQDWQRRIIINNVLQRYFEELHPDLKPNPPVFRSEKLKVLVRVRAFAISRSFDASFARISSLTLDNFCFIAVSNDNNEVVILQCRGAGGDEKSDTTVTAGTHFSLSDESTPAPSLIWTFEDYMERSRFVQHLAWSPWVTDNDGNSRSLLLCAGRTKLRFRWVVADFGLGKPAVRVEDYEGEVNMKKPLTSDAIVEWLPELIDQRYGQLVTYTHDKICKLTIDLTGEDGMKSLKYDRTSWAQPTGSLHLTTLNSEKLLQTLPHMISSTDYLTSIVLETMKGKDSHGKDLQEAIKVNRSAFDTKFETRGNVLTRLWGLALSPLQDIMVTSATFHPSNSPEYIIPADMSSRVIFQSTQRDDFVTTAIQQGTSTESLAFSVRWMVKSMKTQPEKNTAIWKLLDQLDKAMNAIILPEPDPARSVFKDLLFMAPVMIRFRYERVLSIMIGHTDAAEENEKQILEQIATRVLNIPASRYKDTNSSRLMLAHLRRILVMLKLSSEKVDYLIESCNICYTDIPFDSYGSAQCGQGHEFRKYVDGQMYL